MMEVIAKHKGARISAQKARLVADQIRGKSVGEALNILAFSNKKGADLVKKVLRVPRAALIVFSSVPPTSPSRSQTKS